VELSGLAGDLRGVPVRPADSVIVGAGIIGSAIAWRLAQAGLRVTLLDAGRMGGEASWAAAGMLAPGGEIEGPSAWASFGLENLAAYPGFVAELQNASGQSIDFQRLGALEIAMTEADWEHLLARAECQSKLGIQAARMSAEEVRREVPLLQPDLAGALFFAGDALVDPRGIMRALRIACRGCGVEIREGVRATEIRTERESVEVITDQGSLPAGCAVLAAGAWSSQIAVPDCELPRAFPVRGHLAAFMLEGGSIGPILRYGHTYILQRAGGLTIAGTSSEPCGFDRSLDRAILSGIHERAAALVPSLHRWRLADGWLGFRPGFEGAGPVGSRVGHFALAGVWALPQRDFDGAADGGTDRSPNRSVVQRQFGNGFVRAERQAVISSGKRDRRSSNCSSIRSRSSSSPAIQSEGMRFQARSMTCSGKWMVWSSQGWKSSSERTSW
jgi:glycine oxidase